jgi:anti-sigma B factor antagonist
VQPFEIVHYGPSVLFVGGELDMATCPEFERALAKCVESGGPVVVDLSAVSFIDSTGIRALVKGAKSLRAGCVTVHGVSGQVAKVLGMVGISGLPNIHVEPCTTDPYPDSSARLDGRTSEDVAARLQSLRTMFERQRD